MILITQHCFSRYRLPVFQMILSGSCGMPGRLVFGLNQPDDQVKTYNSPDEVPVDTNVPHECYRMVRNRWLGGPFLWQSGLLKQVLSPQVEVVIFEGCLYHLSTWVAAVAARLAGRRVLFWTHGSKRPLKGLRKLIVTSFYRLGHALLVYGRHGRDNLVKAGFSGSKMYPVHNSLDCSRQLELRDKTEPQSVEELRRALFTHPEHPVLLWVGRVTPWRRLDLLIQAAANLREKGRPVNVLIVGPDQDDTLAGLKAETARHELENHVHFYGPCYEEPAVARFFLMAEALVSPGPVGLSCIHALTYGTPVVTHDNLNTQGPEVDAIVPGLSGDLFREADEDSLTESLERVLDWTSDRGERMAVCDRIIREHFSADYQCGVIRAAVAGEPPGGWDWQQHLTG